VAAHPGRRRLGCSRRDGGACRNAGELSRGCLRLSCGDLVTDPPWWGSLNGSREGGSALELVGFGPCASLQQGLSPDFLEDVPQEASRRGGLADTADQCPQGDGEGDSVRIEVGLVGVGSGGVGPGDLDELIDDQQRVEFLCHPVRGLGAQDVLAPAQVGFQIRVPGLALSGKASGLPRWPPLSTARAAFTASQRKQPARAARDCRLCGCVGERGVRVGRPRGRGGCGHRLVRWAVRDG
jgi:hypothetical protein